MPVSSVKRSTSVCMRATRSALSSAVQNVMDGPSWASAGGARSAVRSGTATSADMERRAMDGLLRRSVTKARGPGSTLAVGGSGFQSAAHICGGRRAARAGRPAYPSSQLRGGWVAAFQEGGAAIKLGVFDPIFGSLALPEMLDHVVELGLEAVELGSGGYPGDRHCRPAELLTDRARERAPARVLGAWTHHQCAVLPRQPPASRPRGAELADAVFRDTVRLAAELGVGRGESLLGLSRRRARTPRAPNWVSCAWPPDYAATPTWQWDEVVLPYWTAPRRSRQPRRPLGFEMHPGFVVYNPRDAAAAALGCAGTRSARTSIPRTCSGRASIRRRDPRRWRGHHHVHAKDTCVDPLNVARNGVLDLELSDDVASRTWVFRSVGDGHGPDLLEALRQRAARRGYDHVLSIEHEDSLASTEEGLAGRLGTSCARRSLAASADGRRGGARSGAEVGRSSPVSYPATSLRRTDNALRHGFDGIELSGLPDDRRRRGGRPRRRAGQRHVLGAPRLVHRPGSGLCGPASTDVKRLLELGAELDAPLIVVPIFGRTHTCLPTAARAARRRRTRRSGWPGCARSPSMPNASAAGSSWRPSTAIRTASRSDSRTPCGWPRDGEPTSPRHGRRLPHEHRGGATSAGPRDGRGHARLRPPRRLAAAGAGHGHLDFDAFLGRSRPWLNGWASMECHLSGDAEEVLPQALAFVRARLAAAGA